MEKKSTTIVIDTEEELLKHYAKIYQKFKTDEYSIAMKDAPALLQNLTLIEAKAKEYGLISPNEDVWGRLVASPITLRNRARETEIPHAALFDRQGPLGNGRGEANRAHPDCRNVLRNIFR